MASVKLPVPDLVHSIDPALVAVAEAEKSLPSQMLAVAAPASDAGAGSMVITILSKARVMLISRKLKKKCQSILPNWIFN